MVYLEIATVIALILINGLLAMAELAVVSARRGPLHVMRDREASGPVEPSRLHTDPGQFLSTVQIGITLVGVLSGAFSGATSDWRSGRWLGTRFSADVCRSDRGRAVVTIITYLSLIVGELTPKQIALRNPEPVAAASLRR